MLWDTVLISCKTYERDKNMLILIVIYNETTIRKTCITEFRQSCTLSGLENSWTLRCFLNQTISWFCYSVILWFLRCLRVTTKASLAIRLQSAMQMYHHHHQKASVDQKDQNPVIRGNRNSHSPIPVNKRPISLIAITGNVYVLFQANHCSLKPENWKSLKWSWIIIEQDSMKHYPSIRAGFPPGPVHSDFITAIDQWGVYKTLTKIWKGLYPSSTSVHI